ncbi:hypothetical protein HanOQP8_Chr10g0371141 [Helianthus annuus]|nr:hypothetical protein HanLR1_Chr10g0349041 [Helianthus annuus]KAJ0700702.1 hypothetical protein HanOQP8_Chr10g0371141 [Helianthus annuus]KAJ0776467.1 hypothetical protein HanLR1_Chr02g0045981 [Helianthus annuus]
MVWKNMLVETNMASNVCSFGGWVKAAVTMVNRAISKEDTRGRSKINLVSIVRTKIGKTLTSKDTKERVIRFAFKYVFKGRFVGGDTRR